MDEITALLRSAEAGEPGAAEAFARSIYPKLHRLATRALGGEPAGLTLQPTALVHEAWLRLFPAEPSQNWRTSEHFLAVAGKVMRRVLVDHARASRAQKRRGNRRREPLDVWIELLEDRALDALGLDEALQRLGTLDPQLERIVELRFFAGLTIAETAAALGIATATVERGWRTARAWLRGELGDPSPNGS
jgi:RNA polymerase sigma factor (TIGR02999 family)